MWTSIFLLGFSVLGGVEEVGGNPQAKLLYESLMIGYNKLIRPVKNTTEILRVKLKLRLSQLLDVHEKNQIMTTNVWLQQEWYDFNFVWNPDNFGGVQVLHIPADRIWTPDIVLYNNADGNYQVTIMTKAKVNYKGMVEWVPPAIYRSMCQINVRWFPFDEQDCEMKFGSWTYDGNEVDLIHFGEPEMLEEKGLNITRVKDGIDLEDFYPSVEWQIMEIPSKRHELKFACCPAPYIDITFYLNLRRKTLFYTINLIIPSVGISMLTVTVFYLPSDSAEKVVLCISILISLTVFFLLLVEIIPSTSLVIPLIGLYLLFTMVMVTLSIAVTVITLNVHYRSPSTHQLPRWARIIFIEFLPKILLMSRPQEVDARLEKKRARKRRKTREKLGLPHPDRTHVPTTAGDMFAPVVPHSSSGEKLNPLKGILGMIRKDGKDPKLGSRMKPAIMAAIDGAVYIADHLKQKNNNDDFREDWRYIAQVLDRLFLYIFSLCCLGGTCGIILRAPIIYDTRIPIEPDERFDRCLWNEDANNLS